MLKSAFSNFIHPLSDQIMFFVFLFHFFPLYCRFSLVGLREHIKKRPPLATSEKVQQFVRVGKKNSIRVQNQIQNFFNSPYKFDLLFIYWLCKGTWEGSHNRRLLSWGLWGSIADAYEEKKCPFRFGCEGMS